MSATTEIAAPTEAKVRGPSTSARDDRTDRPQGTNGAEPPQMVQDVPLAEIVRSPFNRDVDTKSQEFAELVESIRIHGVIQPGVARPLTMDMERKPGAPRLELVIGEHRWLGSQAAKRATMPLIVRQLSDVEVVELQTIENDKRKDLSPIEEAEKYQQLITQYEKSGVKKEAAIAKLCEKLSKGKSTVYEALRLIKLPSPVKQLVKSGKMPPSHAGVLAQLEDAPDIQEKLARLIVEKPKGEHSWERTRDAAGIVSFRETKELVDTQVKLSASRKKWLAAMETAKQKGQRVLTEEEQSKVFNRYGSVVSGYVDGRATTSEYSKNWQQKTWKELMGRKAPVAVLGHDDEYRIIELYPSKEAREAVEKNGHKKVKRSSGGGYDSGAYQRQEQKRNETAERMQPVVAAAGKQMLAAAKKIGSKTPWALIATRFISPFHDDPLKIVCEDHGWKVPKGYGTAHKVIASQVARMPANQIPVLLAELLITCTGDWDKWGMKWDPQALELAKFYRVDLVKLTKELAPEPVKEQKAAKPRSRKATAGHGKGKVQTSGSSADKQPPHKATDLPGATAVKTKGKSGLTAAARKKLGDAMKARWAARRKAAGGKKS